MERHKPPGDPEIGALNYKGCQKRTDKTPYYPKKKFCPGEMYIYSYLAALQATSSSTNLNFLKVWVHLV